MFCTGVFFSSWLGTLLLGLGEWAIKRLPLVRVSGSFAVGSQQRFLKKSMRCGAITAKLPTSLTVYNTYSVGKVTCQMTCSGNHCVHMHCYACLAARRLSARQQLLCAITVFDCLCIAGPISRRDPKCLGQTSQNVVHQRNKESSYCNVDCMFARKKPSPRHMFAAD